MRQDDLIRKWVQRKIISGNASGLEVVDKVLYTWASQKKSELAELYKSQELRYVIINTQQDFLKVVRKRVDLVKEICSSLDIPAVPYHHTPNTFRLGISAALSRYVVREIMRFMLYSEHPGPQKVIETWRRAQIIACHQLSHDGFKYTVRAIAAKHSVRGPYLKILNDFLKLQNDGLDFIRAEIMSELIAGGDLKTWWRA